jgi:type IV pilus assembly protein PilX
MSQSCSTTVIPRQSGVALVVSLVILTIVTLLSLSAMRNTNLDTKIAVNHQFKTLSFAAAENALAIVIGPDLSVVDNLTIPTEEGAITNQADFFVSPTEHDINADATLADQPPLSADLSMTNQGERDGLFFSGYQLDSSTHLFLADAIGNVAESRTQTHNRMQVGLLRPRY